MLTNEIASRIIDETITSAQAEAQEAGLTYSVVAYTTDDLIDMFRSVGVEPTQDMLVGMSLAGAQCFAGQMVTKLYTELEASGYYTQLAEAAGLTQDQMDGLKALGPYFSNQIVVYLDNLVGVLKANCADEESACSFVRALIGHELRHSVQRPDLINVNQIKEHCSHGVAWMQTQEGIQAYMARPEEADAYAFQYAMMRGEVTFEDVRTWHPENVA